VILKLSAWLNFLLPPHQPKVCSKGSSASSIDEEVFHKDENEVEVGAGRKNLDAKDRLSQNTIIGARNAGNRGK